uniref:Uncharacterized protein n=1 Tax=viral metagenome TaxID=1070528 RepID=A0A6C0AEX5_9ZZZZ
MEINISDIPDFLKDSEFYRNLDLNFDEPITIPKLKINDEVNNIKDFKNLSETLNFFDVDKSPKSFIKYYQNNSKEVFESLDNDIYLINLCNLKIKNPEQFFLTYKIISLHKLNPEEYNNYINYALNNVNELKKNYLMNFEEYKNLVDKLCSTRFLELYFYESKSNIIRFRLGRLSQEFKIYEIQISKECILEIIKSIKNENFLSLTINFLNIISKISIEINEFNKKYILKQLKQALFFKDENQLLNNFSILISSLYGKKFFKNALKHNYEISVIQSD